MFHSIFDDDPFFRDFDTPMGRISSRMNYAGQGRRHTEPPGTIGMSPFDDPFGGMGMGSMFSNMNSMMLMPSMMPNMMNMQQSRPMSNSSFHSSFTSISYGNGSSPPNVYQASSSTKIGPNGIKETQKSERNSTTGLQKMAIGHHIGDRSHIIEKSQNSRTGDKEESQEYINLEEEEAEEFDAEFKQKARSMNRYHPQHQHRSIAYHPVERHQPYQTTHHHHHRHSPLNESGVEYTPTRRIDHSRSSQSRNQRREYE